jgi:NADP-dependent 3-hydroxy acid dehydrogenase YdfG
MTKTLAGKVALVTGGSRGIGAASVEPFVTGTVLNVDGGFGA